MDPFTHRIICDTFDRLTELHNQYVKMYEEQSALSPFENTSNGHGKP